MSPLRTIPNRDRCLKETSGGSDSIIFGGPPNDKTFSYTSEGLIERIDYEDGSFKNFYYTGDAISIIDWTIGTSTRRKIFYYSMDGLISFIDEQNI
jgi:hypothetical protein